MISILIYTSKSKCKRLHLDTNSDIVLGVHQGKKLSVLEDNRVGAFIFELRDIESN